MGVKFFVDEDGYAVAKKPKGQRVDTLPIVRSHIPILYFSSADELISYGGKGGTMIFDIECYWNYFLIGFMHVETGKYIEFELSCESQINLNTLNWVIWNFRLVGFNSKNYDIPMLLLSLRGYDNQRLKEISNRIIGNRDLEIPGMTPFEISKEYKLKTPKIDHIDLIEVCPLDGSLKKYAARIHAKRLQDLPFDPEMILSREDAMTLKNYCLGSDIPATAQILSELSEQIKLRYELTNTYGTDVRSKSDAQIAEAVIAHELERMTGRQVRNPNLGPGEEFQYIVPGFIQFQTPMLRRMLEEIAKTKFVTSGSGSPMWPVGLGEVEQTPKGPKWVLKVRIADSVYKLGMGGLHSTEECADHIADETCELHDDDVESYYPRIILNQKLYPKHLGEAFLEVYNAIVEKRIGAKAMAKACKKVNDKEGEIANKIVADSLKITINGSFGKLGSIFSTIYAPDLMIQVTISGQLCLLMLIEAFELNGIKVISANTDGIVTKVPKHLLATKDAIIKSWEEWTNFKTERTHYSAVYSRDVNNYFAVKIPDDKGNVKVKLKGAYGNPWNDPELAIFRFHNNPKTTICIQAVEQFLIDKTPIEKTILECKDITKFISAKNVNGGGHKDGIYLGKMVRWYYAKDTCGQINYVSNGNKVGDSENAKPIMDLPEEFPDDIDYDWYMKKANAILYEIGFLKKNKILDLFD